MEELHERSEDNKDEKLSVVTGSRGPKLVYKNFTYTIDKSSNSKIFWRCSKRAICKVRITTDIDCRRILRHPVGEHTDTENPKAEGVLKARNYMREKGKESLDIPYDELYSECAEEHIEYLDEAGSKTAMLAVAKYARRVAKSSSSPDKNNVKTQIQTETIVEQEPEHDKELTCRLCLSEILEAKTTIFDKDIEKFLKSTHITIPSIKKVTDLVCDNCFNNAMFCIDFTEAIIAAQNHISDSTTNEDENLIQDESDQLENPFDEDECEKLDDEEEQTIDTVESESSPKQKGKRKETLITSINFVCMYCKESYQSYNLLVEHLSSKVCQDTTCNICNRRFDNHRKYKIHMYNHKRQEEDSVKKKEKKLMCEECAKEFTNVFSLNCHIESTHRRVERDDIVFKCNYCNEQFNAHMDLVEHNKIHRTKCEICGKVFENRRRMVAHRTQVHGEKKNICEECGKGFRSKLLLNQHMHIHTGIKTYICNVCPDKAYAKLSSLRKHQKKAHYGGEQVEEIEEEHDDE